MTKAYHLPPPAFRGQELHLRHRLASLQWLHRRSNRVCRPGLRRHHRTLCKLDNAQDLVPVPRFRRTHGACLARLMRRGVRSVLQCRTASIGERDSDCPRSQRSCGRRLVRRFGHGPCSCDNCDDGGCLRNSGSRLCRLCRLKGTRRRRHGRAHKGADPSSIDREPSVNLSVEPSVEPSVESVNRPARGTFGD